MTLSFPRPNVRFFAGAVVFCVLWIGITAVVTANADTPVPSGCFADHQSAAAASRGGSSQNLGVSIASVTRVQLSDDGDVRSAATNTGCAPKASDEFVVESGDTYQLASPEVVSAALDCKFSGTWQDTSKWHNCR